MLTGFLVAIDVRIAASGDAPLAGNNTLKGIRYEANRKVIGLYLWFVFIFSGVFQSRNI